MSAEPTAAVYDFPSWLLCSTNPLSRRVSPAHHPHRSPEPNPLVSRTLAGGFSQHFFCWYNTEHHHSGSGLLTPEVLHYGRAGEVTQRRQMALSQAYERHPEPPDEPTVVWINPPLTPITEAEPP